MPTIAAQLGSLKIIDFYKTQKPYWLFIENALDANLTNVVTETVQSIPVTDVRGHETDYTLNEHGFQFIKHDQCSGRSMTKSALCVTEYFPQVEKVIKDSIPNSEKILIYD